MSAPSTVVRQAANVLKENSPVILSGCAAAGVVTTVIFAIKATPKACTIIEEEGLEEPLDIVKGTWKLYILAVASGVITIACIIGANRISLKRSAALASLYSLSEITLKEYQEKVVEKIGEKKEQEVRDEIAHDRIVKNPRGENPVILTGKGDVLCYDSISGRYFKSDIERIRKSINDLNQRMNEDYFVAVNDLYYELGIPGIRLGESIGWRLPNLIDPNFSSQLCDDGTPCLVMDFLLQPQFEK